MEESHRSHTQDSLIPNPQRGWFPPPFLVLSLQWDQQAQQRGGACRDKGSAGACREGSQGSQPQISREVRQVLKLLGTLWTSILCKARGLQAEPVLCEPEGGSKRLSFPGVCASRSSSLWHLKSCVSASGHISKGPAINCEDGFLINSLSFLPQGQRSHQ